MKLNMLDMTVDELQAAAADTGLRAYRTKQLADWVYRKGVTDPANMTNLPSEVAEHFAILTSRVAGKRVSSDKTVKLLLELYDGEHVETVLIPTKDRATACLSTQVGCGFACQFCASGIGGFKRNLSAGEILEQILHLQKSCDVRVSNVVFMGTGEPLANYEATVAAIRAIVDPARFGLSARRVTVSTVGLPEQIRRLAREDLPITLAISLHAPNDALRKELMPAAAKYPLAEIVSAAEEFYASHKREVTLEYLLLGGVNDTNVCAEALALLAKRLRCNVNLVRYNPVEPSAFEPPTTVAVQAFARRLRRRGINTHIRRSRGADADAACGQLRAAAAPSN